ncbi:hypothetical protein [Paracoccus sp. SSK6]|uniref:hypothetical protein n=1 Tax=Paracoccus sp. SSK6 TaxID=3143131 RepID=UPI00321AC6FB
MPGLTLSKGLRPGTTIESVSCIEGEPPAVEDLCGFDGIVFPGSPIQMHEDRPEARAALRFMAVVFQTGTPSFGSCAGLQITAVAAGRTGPRAGGTKAAAGPVLQGRPRPGWPPPCIQAS